MTCDGDKLTGISMDCMSRSQMGGRALGRAVRRYVVAAATSPVPTHTGVEMLLTYWLTLSRLSKPSRYRRSMLKMLMLLLLLRSVSSVVQMRRQVSPQPERSFTVFQVGVCVDGEIGGPKKKQKPKKKNTQSHKAAVFSVRIHCQCVRWKKKMKVQETVMY